METLNESTQTTTPTKLLLNIDEVKAITGFSTTTIYKHVKQGAFPAPILCLLCLFVKSSIGTETEM